MGYQIEKSGYEMIYLCKQGSKNFPTKEFSPKQVEILLKTRRNTYCRLRKSLLPGIMRRGRRCKYLQKKEQGEAE